MLIINKRGHKGRRTLGKRFCLPPLRLTKQWVLNNFCRFPPTAFVSASWSPCSSMAKYRGWKKHFWKRKSIFLFLLSSYWNFCRQEYYALAYVITIATAPKLQKAKLFKQRYHVCKSREFCVCVWFFLFFFNQQLLRKAATGICHNNGQNECACFHLSTTVSGTTLQFYVLLFPRSSRLNILDRVSRIQWFREFSLVCFLM